MNIVNRDSLVASESSVTRTHRLMRDAVVNNLAAPISAIVGILLVPIILRVLGQDGYGLWIIATSMSGILASIDFGLGWSVSRVVASDLVGSEGDNADFVRSAANIYMLIGMSGGIVLGVAGLFSGGYLHLPPVEHETAKLVFWLVGATLFADQMSAFGFAVLNGLRRFKLINFMATLASVTWATWVVVVLINGGSVIAVAACQLTVAVMRSAGTLWLIARLTPDYRFRMGQIRLNAFRRHASFAASSQLTTILSAITWGSAPVLIGFISGSAAAVPFYIGQKIPLAVSSMSWRAAEVLFPAASEDRHNLVKSEEVLRIGLRWCLVLALPFTVLVFIFAPGILHVWVGNPPLGSVMVLRILAVTVLADAIAVAPLHLLWGRGAMRPILATYIAQGLGMVALTLALVYLLGVAGAAWGMLVPICISAVVLFVGASRTCKMDAWKLAAETWRGLALPILACVLTASSVLYFRNDSRGWLVAAMAVGGLSYLATLFGFTGYSEEKMFARDALFRQVHTGLIVFRRGCGLAPKD